MAGTLFSKLARACRHYWAGTDGATMVVFGMVIPVITAAMGMSIDMARTYLVRERLSHALDAAALAAASSTQLNEAGMEARMEAFFQKNYAPDAIGTPYGLHMTLDGNTLTVYGSVYLDTMFLGVIGVSRVNLSSHAVVQRAVRGLEVALVLDNTGSMSENDNIGTLRTAASNFVNILFDSADNPTAVKIGLVPYSNSVRVGRYGLGKNPDGTTYGDGYNFVTLPSGVSYTTSHSSSTGWYGCLIAHNPSGWNASSTHNDPYPADVTDDYEGPWDIYRYETYQTSCTGKWPNKVCTSAYKTSSVPNDGCPYANVVPLTSSQATLLANIGTMRAHGNTLGNTGMEWGYRLLSSDRPFTEGSPWMDPDWRKAVVMMTDGMNTKNSEYSYFWRSRNNQLDTTDFNERFLEVCTSLKAKGVQIYTIIFDSGSDGPDQTTKDYYRQCASSDAQYYYAPSQAELISTFNNIAAQLSNLYISE